tara:strand:- start:150 stop:428 length:279 start_codon:yes stop_codon:yes gene_type:complete
MALLLNTAIDGFDITPSDTDDLIHNGTQTDAAAVTIGGSGDIKVTTVRGTTLTFTNRPAGTDLPYKVRRVWATGTTATGLIGAVEDYADSKR